ncbi:hypothetical protein SPRG_09412 [Saprolegnia parasitica CBS 223.65]|uniref:Uncharacterized protein n=1 Tax=Saprolegnia parasitica (strain CBS 223.65) TaxID=695850 RepID=A0A067C3U5_SAPPC|nr:hypothetical protein SPRG_09412 [Saprolegnia parasitica CBS 223.65]KDO25469.1 hypothetical protein SPRG_09412 [Saprolegnia parasitica CBS 223.65]|eukprot:XP_012203894.1 hypothetical protein SPRG_09412 [Saprolegnia parasitica CBS 223.65]
MGKKGLAIKCSVKPSGRPVLEKMASKTDDNTSLDTTMEAMDLNWNNGAPVPVGSGSVAHSFASMNEIAVAAPDEPLSRAEVEYWSTVLVNAT